MRQNRQSKIVAILALCVSVVGLTLGFAAFSNTLTISSSATVSPDESDFKLVLYGLPEGNYDHDIFDDEGDGSPALFTSTTMSYPIPWSNLGSAKPPTATAAIIDNDNLSLKGLMADFKEPQTTVDYYFLLKNEGQYDAYGNASDFQLPAHTCEAGEGTTESLVRDACEYMEFNFHIGFSDEANSRVDWDATKLLDESGYLRLEKGKYYYVHVSLQYDSGSSTPRADGPFTVKWDDIKLNFSTAKQ